MSFSMNHSVESEESLLQRLTGKTPKELLLKELEAQGITVVKTEEVTLDFDDMYWGDTKANKLFLSDGRVFVPKLTERFQSRGNYQMDTYEYVLSTDTPEVIETFED